LDYDYLGNWEEREGNSNVEVELLRRFLNRQGYDKPLVEKAIFDLERAAQFQADSSWFDHSEKIRRKDRFA
jgi:type I restriction enzyme R subunit